MTTGSRRPSSFQEYSSPNRRQIHRFKKKSDFERSNEFPRRQTSDGRRPAYRVQKCKACQAAGEPFLGHDIRECPNIAPRDRGNVLKTFNLEIDLEDDEEGVEDELCAEESYNDACEQVGALEVDDVTVAPSPKVNVKLNKTTVTCTFDTGCTGSIVTLRNCEMSGLHVYPSGHSAIQADGNSLLRVIGEVHTNIEFNDGLFLPISAVVVTKLKAGLLVGMNFMKEHGVVIDIPQNILIFAGNRIVNFNSLQGNPKTSLLRSEVNNVIFPGDSITLPIPRNFYEDESFAVEPREECNFFNPCVVENITGSLSIVNESDSPIKIKRNQILGQARSLMPATALSVDANLSEVQGISGFSTNKFVFDKKGDFTSAITVDPDNILSESERLKFRAVNRKYNNVFNPKFGRYNDQSGKVRASVFLGPTKPTPKKGKVPCYSSDKLAILQEKFDELVDLGVLRRPEDLGIEVVHTSPSFLVKKSNDSYRLVTSFVELNKFIRPLPSKLSNTQDVLTSLGKWKFIIKTDLKSAYFQISMSKESQKWLGTNSPFKGIFVYDAAAMGLRNMAEYLEEVVSRVVGDMLAEGVLAKLSDDLFVGGNTIQETLSNWDRLLQRLQENNLFLSADKTFICPSSIKVIGWVWKQGSIAVDHHRVNPLTTCPLPTNVKQLRSFIGAFRAISICIRGYANYLNFLEGMAAGKESSEKLLWNETMTKTFHEAQNALRRPQALTLPHPEDQLILISDGCNSPPAVGSTLFIKRGSKEYIAGFFSAKIKKYQLLWLPCEVEALCINLTINSFSHYIRESKHTTKFLTDSKSCVQAFEKLAKGGFSLSPRISSFLMNLNALNVSINHIAGTSIPLTDFCSRNPVDCSDKSCQVCSFVEESADVEINALSLEEVLSGTSRMPFLNANTWMKLQKDDPDLRRAFSQLTGGTRPGKKEKRLKQLRRYLLIASVSNNGTLIRRKPNPCGRDLELIIVPQGIVSGLIAALHIRFGHPLKSQMRKVWDRYFFALDVDKFLDECMLSCSLCMSLKKLPKELIQQSTSDVPCTVGKVFSADVIRRENQKILILLDIFSSFKVGSLISNEQENTLQQSLIQLASTLKHPEGCVIKVDHAPGFQALRNDKVLASVGIELDFGRLKNKNQNPTIDKSIQEVEYEIKCLAPSGGVF